MGEVGYDRLDGLRRLGEARAKLDHRAGIILTCHAALEREIDVVLAQLLPRSEKLRGLGFGQKLSVLEAAWKGSADAGDKLGRALFHFNELRNAVAHGDRVKEVDEKLKLLTDAFDAILPSAAEAGDVELVAAGLVGYLADGYSRSTFTMLRSRLTILVLACLAGACTVLAGVLLSAGLLRGGDALVDWIVTRWSAQQIEAALQFVEPVSLTMLVIGLALIFSLVPRPRDDGLALDDARD